RENVDDCAAWRNGRASGAPPSSAPCRCGVTRWAGRCEGATGGDRRELPALTAKGRVLGDAEERGCAGSVGGSADAVHRLLRPGTECREDGHEEFVLLPGR